MELPITETLADGRKADLKEFYLEVLGALRGLDERLTALEADHPNALTRLDALDASARTTAELQNRLAAVEEALSRFLPHEVTRSTPAATFDVDQPTPEIPSTPIPSKTVWPST